MKAGWATKTIADVCSVVNGGTPKTGVSEYWDGTHQWITPAEMGKRSSPYVARTERTITDAGMQSSSARLLPPLSVILSSRAPIGHLVINTEPMATNQGCKGLVPSDGLNHKYLYYYLSSIVQLLNDLGTGATFKELSGGKLKEVPIPVPPLAEQQRIVAILDKAFEAIAAARANAEQNRQNARFLFESYLQSVFNQRGEEWVERYLVDISKEFGRGKSKHRPRNEPKLYGGQYPFIQTGDISRAKHWLTSYSQTYSEQGLAQSRLWPKGTICIAIVGATVGETAILNFDACFPDSVIGIVPDENLANGEYVEYLLQAFKQILKDKGKGTARDNINLGTFESQKFPFPPLALQNEIVATIDSLSVETQRLESLYQRKIAALDELKQSLLHQAFSGNL
ncbi:restriction endonuclease subunit S [Aeromonas veronii]